MVFSISRSRGLLYNNYTDLLKIYETNVKLTTLELRVKFNGETGIDGGGLTRELFPVFWKSAENIMCEGSSAKIPVLSPEYVSHYFLLGKILSHGFILTGFLPIGLASTHFCVSYYHRIMKLPMMFCSMISSYMLTPLKEMQ